VFWVSMRIVLRGGPPSYTILVRSCVSHSDTQEPSKTKAASRWLLTSAIF